MEKKYSDEELINNLKEVKEKYKYISRKTLKEHGKFRDHIYYRRFQSLDNAMKVAGIDIEKNKIIKNQLVFKGINKKYTKNDLIKIMMDYNNNIGFPTERKFVASNGLPTYTTYFKNFGSFKNAILISGIEIPKERERYFDREKLSNKELLELLRYYTDRKLENNIYLLTNDEIDFIKEMPSTNSYVSRFGGVINAYKEMGIDYFEFNKKTMEKDMIEKYKELKDLLRHTPNSRELDKYSQKGLCYSMNAYENHFGSLSKLQKQIGYTPTTLGKSISDEEMIDGLKILADILQRIPSYKEINDCNWIPSIHCYEKRFGSFSDALEIAGLENISRTYITPLGHKALSSYEYNFLLMLEQYKLNFEQEEYYSKYIEGFKRRYRFDFTLNINKSNIFIEVFGMINIDWYEERLKHKIKICKENNLPLVYFYPSDIINKTNEELYQLLQIKIKELIREPNGSFFNVKEAI